MKDKFAYIVPPSPTSTVDVDSYYPTSNWQDGRWAYQDQSYLLHDPRLRLPIYRGASGSESRTIKNPVVAPIPLPAPAPNLVPKPDLTSGTKEEKSYVGWYFVGGALLLAGGGYALYRHNKSIKLKTA
jgi:hypothetical protein